MTRPPRPPSADPTTGRPIRVLPDAVIDQIAAGEVVERPASVVKELCENSLDAGATHLDVEVEQGGKKLIRVADNGHGMSPEAARRALARHATSKLVRIEDLMSLTTMGFRGEALPAIAAVSRLVLVTRTREEVAGTRIEVVAGEIASEREVGAPVGTRVEIRDLLANVPARLKFLKGDATEASHVTDVVTKLALANPGVHVKLRHNGRTSIEAPHHDSAYERVQAISGSGGAGGARGARGARRLHRAAHEEAGIVVDAYLAAPGAAQTTTRGLQLFVGRRAIRDRGLIHAVRMGYGEVLPKNRYPVAVIFVDVPDGAVDVNVHPQKQEVRFSDAGAVYAAVRHAVQRGVSAAPWLSDGLPEGVSPVKMRALAARVPPATRASERGASYQGGFGQRRDLAGAYARAAGRLMLPFGRQGQPGASRGAGDSGFGDASRARPRGLAEAPFPVAEIGAKARPAPSGDPGDGAEREDGVSPGERAHETGEFTDRGERRAESGEPPGAPAVYETRTHDAERDPGGHAAHQGPECHTGEWAPDGGGPAVADAFFSQLRYLGQLDRTFLVCETAGELILVDQHAAHERVAFQRLRERYKERAISVQRLLFPEQVDLAPEQAAVAEESEPALAQLGFEVAPFGDSTYAGATFVIKTVPTGLREGDSPAAVFGELLRDLAERGGSRALEERLDMAMATIACHSVVRAGDALSPREVYSLFESLDGVEFRAHCPHGRPVLLRISVAEISRRFGR